MQRLSIFVRPGRDRDLGDTVIEKQGATVLIRDFAALHAGSEIDFVDDLDRLSFSQQSERYRPAAAHLLRCKPEPDGHQLVFRNDR